MDGVHGDVIEKGKTDSAPMNSQQDLFGLEMILDNDGNMIMTEGLVLQED